MFLTNISHSFVISILASVTTILLIPMLLIICVSYIKIFCISRNVASSVRKIGVSVGQKSRKQAVSLTMTIIIVSNVVCWLPILIVNFMSFFDINIEVNLLGAIVVGIMPINSLINPIIYTLRSSNVWS